jgi:hypothetical protein
MIRMTLLGALLFGIPLFASPVTFTIVGTYGSVTVGGAPSGVPVSGSSFILQFSTLGSSPLPPSGLYPFWTLPTTGGTYTNNGTTTNLIAYNRFGGPADNLGLPAAGNPSVYLQDGGLYVSFQLSGFPQSLLDLSLVGPSLYSGGASPSNPPDITIGTFSLSAFQNGASVSSNQGANALWYATIVGAATLTTSPSKSTSTSTSPEPSTGILFLVGVYVLHRRIHKMRPLRSWGMGRD